MQVAIGYNPTYKKAKLGKTLQMARKFPPKTPHMAGVAIGHLALNAAEKGLSVAPQENRRYENQKALRNLLLGKAFRVMATN